MLKDLRVPTYSELHRLARRVGRAMLHPPILFANKTSIGPVPESKL